MATCLDLLGCDARLQLPRLEKLHKHIWLSEGDQAACENNHNACKNEGMSVTCQV